MGFFSSEADKEKSPWANHRNAKPAGRGERVSGWLANTGRERMLRENMANNEYEDWLKSMRSAPGGQTPAPPKRMSGPQRRQANKILRESKQPRGKK